MWGGRFGEGPDAVMDEINASIDFDRHLHRQDIIASKAHAASAKAPEQPVHASTRRGLGPAL